MKIGRGGGIGLVNVKILDECVIAQSSCQATGKSHSLFVPLQ